jgi:hypothetical protein
MELGVSIASLCFGRRKISKISKIQHFILNFVLRSRKTTHESLMNIYHVLFATINMSYRFFFKDVVWNLESGRACYDLGFLLPLRGRPNIYR